MNSKEFVFPDSFTALFVKDVDSTKITIVFTKEVEGKEINFALDFPGQGELDSFSSWLNLDRTYGKLDYKLD